MAIQSRPIGDHEAAQSDRLGEGDNGLTLAESVFKPQNAGRREQARCVRDQLADQPKTVFTAIEGMGRFVTKFWITVGLFAGPDVGEVRGDDLVRAAQLTREMTDMEAHGHSMSFSIGARNRDRIGMGIGGFDPDIRAGLGDGDGDGPTARTDIEEPSAGGQIGNQAGNQGFGFGPRHEYCRSDSQSEIAERLVSEHIGERLALAAPGDQGADAIDFGGLQRHVETGKEIESAELKGLHEDPFRFAKPVADAFLDQPGPAAFDQIQ